MPLDIEAHLFAGSFLLLFVLCVALAVIDLYRGIIPDGLNLTIAVVGLVKASATGGAMAGVEALCEAVVVGATGWLLRRLYFAWRGIQGLGLGDVKFLAAAAIWVGFSGMPLLILIAALGALTAAGGLQLAGHSLTRKTALPFGPFLAMGLLLAVAAQQWLGGV